MGTREASGASSMIKGIAVVAKLRGLKKMDQGAWIKFELSNEQDYAWRGALPNIIRSAQWFL